ncbi:MAG TPA: chorismate mutase [Longimicrobiales bacterium]|nr:chorismate mutase [Longimicrobiales bacterium]
MSGRERPEGQPAHGEERDLLPPTERLQSLRARIAAADEALVEILAERLALARAIGAVKRELDLPVLDPAREAEVVRRAAERAREQGVDPELVRDIVWRIMAQARGAQR